MYCCSHITDGKIEHKALWALARGHRRGLFWLKGLAWLPWEGDNGTLPPRFQNINFTKPEPSKPKLPSPQILPSFSALSGNKLIQIFLQRSNSHIYLQASPTHPDVLPFSSCSHSVAGIQSLHSRDILSKATRNGGNYEHCNFRKIISCRQERKATTDALFLSNRRARVPMTPASQGLLGSSSKAW